MAAKVVLVIPARYASTRLPAKPLADIQGHPMIQWVYERARRTRGATRTCIATDDERIAKVVREFGGDVAMTSTEINSGTDRVAAVADQMPGGPDDIFVNVQGDEPLIDPKAIETGIELVSSGRFPMGTVMVPLKSAEELRDPSVVKVLADRTGRAIYFSRLPIPYGRLPGPPAGEDFVCYRHVGLYIYTRATLLRFRGLPVSSLEKAEMLEQLRAMADGIPIGIALAEFTSIGVDTPEDLGKVRDILAAKAFPGL